MELRREEAKNSRNCQGNYNNFLLISVLVSVFIHIDQYSNDVYANEVESRSSQSSFLENRHEESMTSLVSKDDEALAPHIKWLKMQQKMHKNNRNKERRLSRVKQNSTFLSTHNE